MHQLHDALVPRLMGSDSLVVKDAAGVSDGETPVDFEFDAIDPPVPGGGVPAQLGERGYPLAPQALPRPQAGFQFGGVEPAAVFGRVVHREASPQRPSLLDAEGFDDRFLAMGV